MKNSKLVCLPALSLALYALISYAETLTLSLDSARLIAQRASPYRWEERFHRRAVIEKAFQPIERLLPSPFFNLSYSYDESNLFGEKIKERSYTGQIGITQPLFSSDLVAGLAGIGYLLQSEKAQARAARANLEYRITTAYYNLLKLQEIYRVKRAEVIKRESLRNFSAELFRLGRISRLDFLRSESDFLLSQMEEDEAKKAWLLAERELAMVIGWEGDATRSGTQVPFLFCQEELTPPETVEFYPFEVFWERMIKKNPELTRALAERNLARLSYYSAVFSFLPSLSLSLSSHYRDSVSFPKGVSDWRSKDFLNLSISFNLPFLDLTDFSLSLLSQSQNRNRQEFLWRETWFSLLSSARSAYLALKSAYARYSYAKKNLELARELLRLAEEERRLGRISYLDFLDIETKYNKAYEAYITSIVEIKEASAKISFLFGGEE